LRRNPQRGNLQESVTPEVSEVTLSFVSDIISYASMAEKVVARLLFLAHALLVQSVTFVLRPTATYRALELGVPPFWLGALSASFAIAPLLLAVPSGHAVDRLGERRVMLAGALLVCAAAGGYALLGRSVPGLVVATVLLGIGHLCSVVSEQALVANRTPRERYDTAFGHYTFAVSLGQALGPGLIVWFGGDRAIPDTADIFAGSVVVAVLLLVTTVALRPSAGGGPRADTSPGGVRGLLRLPGLMRAVTVSSMLLAAVDITLVYLPALGAERGIASGVIGVLLAIRALASMTARLFLGRLARALGRRRLLVGTMALSVVALAVTPVPMPLWLVAVVVMLVGIGLGAGQPLTMSWVAEATPPGLRGRAMSVRLTGNRVGQVVVPSLAGLLAAGAGAGGVLVLTAAGLAAAGFAARRLE
jgi:MFS family permease